MVCCLIFVFGLSFCFNTVVCCHLTTRWFLIQTLVGALMSAGAPCAYMRFPPVSLTRAC